MPYLQNTTRRPLGRRVFSLFVHRARTLAETWVMVHTYSETNLEGAKMGQEKVLILLGGPLQESWRKLTTAHQKSSGIHSAEYEDTYNEWLYRAGALSCFLAKDYPPVIEMLEVMLAEVEHDMNRLKNAFDELEKSEDDVANDNNDEDRDKVQTRIARDLLMLYRYKHEVRLAIKCIKDRIRRQKKKAELSATPSSGTSG